MIFFIFIIIIRRDNAISLCYIITTALHCHARHSRSSFFLFFSLLKKKLFNILKKYLFFF